MAKVLVIDDDATWLQLICDALPEHEVYPAPGYKDGRALLDGDATYDVAIVDLNLLLGNRNDRLGGRLLKYMKDQYPAIRRIVLTGEPPTSVREVLNEYDPDDLLLKTKMDMSVLRRVVETALERAAGGVPDKFSLKKVELRNSLHSWKEAVLSRLAQRARTLQNDIDNAGRVGKNADDSAAALARLESRQQNLKADCANLEATIAGIRSDDDLARAGNELERLKAIYRA